MLFTAIAALLFPVTIMAVPTGKPAAGEDQCTPVSYILSEYNRKINPGYAFLSFNIQSSYTIDSPAKDPVGAGVNCEADGAIIDTSSKQCNDNGGKIDELVFMLRGRQDEDKYRIHHKWQCNDATWESINDIQLPPVTCHPIEDGTNGKTVECTSGPINFAPQNVHKMKDGKKDDKTAKPSTKPTDCRNCSA